MGEMTAMNWILVLAVSVIGGLVEVEGGRAKAVGQMRVTGPGFSVSAKSARHCLALCNKQPACDAANYHQLSGKCRIFTRCAPTIVVENSARHFYFSKRPRIQEKGFSYHKESDSCLKLISELADYAAADMMCREQGGRLASLSEPDINAHATNMLLNSKAQFAWIGLTDSMTEGDPLHSDGKRVSETNFFPVAEQGHRNDTSRNCWSLSDSGEWVEHPCKDRKQYSICQIIAY